MNGKDIWKINVKWEIISYMEMGRIIPYMDNKFMFQTTSITSIGSTIWSTPPSRRRPQLTSVMDSYGAHWSPFISGKGSFVKWFILLGWIVGFMVDTSYHTNLACKLFVCVSHVLTIAVAADQVLNHSDVRVGSSRWLTSKQTLQTWRTV